MNKNSDYHTLCVWQPSDQSSQFDELVVLIEVLAAKYKEMVINSDDFASASRHLTFTTCL